MGDLASGGGVSEGKSGPKKSVVWLPDEAARTRFDLVCQRHDGRLIGIERTTFDRAKLAVYHPGDSCSDDVWCYSTFVLAVVAAVLWCNEDTPEPAGWMRHPATGRRRPDGDPTQEYVRR